MLKSLLSEWRISATLVHLIEVVAQFVHFLSLTVAQFLLLLPERLVMVFREFFSTAQLAVTVFEILKFLVPRVVETLHLVAHNFFNLSALLSDQLLVRRMRCDGSLHFCNE